MPLPAILPQRPGPRLRPALVFSGVAASVYAAVFLVSRGSSAAAHSKAIGLAALCDLAITVPVLFYLLVVRGGHASWPTVIPVAFAGLRAAALLLPGGPGSFLPPLKWLAVPFEIWLITAAVRRVRRAPGGPDVPARIEETVRAVVRSERLAMLVAGELLVFYYAVLARRAETQPEFRAMSYAESSGYRLFSILLAIAVVCEGVPLHLFLNQWSPAVAWVFTGLGVYALLWTLALARSLALRPILIRDDCLVLRAGILWAVCIDRSNVRAVRPATGGIPARRHAGNLLLTIINEPQWIIELHEPVTAHGLYGRRRAVTCLGVAADEPNAFAQFVP
ncbi:MAG: hypothetical protein U0Q18_01280 [Bryobacteraceae bacterium]